VNYWLRLLGLSLVLVFVTVIISALFGWDYWHILALVNGMALGIYFARFHEERELRAHTTKDLIYATWFRR
jgi:positive regulator of sigma E activity